MARTIRSSKVVIGPLIPDHNHIAGAEFRGQEPEVRFNQRKLFDRQGHRIRYRSVVRHRQRVRTGIDASGHANVIASRVEAGLVLC